MSATERPGVPATGADAARERLAAKVRFSEQHEIPVVHVLATDLDAVLAALRAAPSASPTTTTVYAVETADGRLSTLWWDEGEADQCRRFADRPADYRVVKRMILGASSASPTNIPHSAEHIMPDTSLPPLADPVLDAWIARELTSNAAQLADLDARPDQGRTGLYDARRTQVLSDREAILRRRARQPRAAIGQEVVVDGRRYRLTETGWQHVPE